MTISSQNLPTGLSLKGSGFVSWSTVYMNSANLSTTFVDSHHLMATITWQDMTAVDYSSGTVYISVGNAGQTNLNLFNCPNGGDSKTIPIAVQ